MVEETASVEYTLEGASHYEDDFEISRRRRRYGRWSDPDVTISREEAIKIQQTKVEGLKLDIRQSDIDIGKLEKKGKKGSYLQ